MADNLLVLNGVGTATILRAIDQGNGTLIPGSVPMLPNGSAMVGALAIASSLPVNLAGTAIVNLNYVGGSAVTLGQLTAASSIPVVLPSNQVVSALITNASVTSLISNAMLTTNLAQVGGTTFSLGQKVSATSISVVFASDAVLTTTFTPTGSSFTSVISTAGAPVAIAVKATSGTLLGVSLYNNNTSTPCFLKIYNATSGAITVGTNTTNLVFNVGVPPGSQRDVPLGNGIVLSTAICYAVTGLVANTDTTVVGINDITGIIQFN